MTTVIHYNTAADYSTDTDPIDIPWAARQRQALVPFDVVDGLPVNPVQSGLPAGRGSLRHWGEAVCADAAVICLDADGARRLLMVERSDGHGWALPGGKLDPGETPVVACARELVEETSLDLDPAQFVMLPARGVPDPRAGAHAWMVTVPGVTWLRNGGALPPVQGLDDASDAAWIRADSWGLLIDEVEVFSAHTDLIAGILDASMPPWRPGSPFLPGTVLSRYETKGSDRWN